MGGGGSPTQQATSTTSSSAVSNPWSGIQRNLVEAVGTARGLANQPPSQFPYTWQTGQPLLTTGADYSVYSIPGLMGLMNQPAWTYGTQNQYGGPGSDNTEYGSGVPQEGSAPFNSGGSPYMGGYSAYTPYSSGYGPGVDTSMGTASPTTGGYGAGVNPYNVSGGQGYNTYGYDPNQVGPGTMPGYYQNFATGQSMPYSNYLPYVSEVSPLNTMQTAGINQTAGIAGQGDPAQWNTQRMLADTASGQYLNPSSNPYLQATYQAAADPVMKNFENAVYPGLRSSAAQAGQFGGSNDALLQGQAGYNLGQTLQNLGTGIFGQNYQAERANQLKGALEVPAISANAFTYPQAMTGAGTIYQQQAQNQLSDMVSQYQQQVNYPMTMLQDYAATIGGMPVQGYGNTSGTGATMQKSINPYYVSPGQQGLGAASSLGGMGAGLLGAISMFL